MLLPAEGRPMRVINDDFIEPILTFRADNSSTLKALLSFLLINLYTSVCIIEI